MDRVAPRLTYANVMSTAGVLLAMTGTAWAVSANSIGSRQIKANAVKTADIAANAVTSAKVADGTLTGSDFAPGQAPQGPVGPAGADGTAITPDQAVAKVKDADGPGSGLDADTVDGVNSSDIGRAYTVHRSRTASGFTVERFATLPLGALGEVRVNCLENLAGDAVVQVEFVKGTSATAATLNASAVAGGVENPVVSTPTDFEIADGATRGGMLIPAGPGSGFVTLPDDAGVAGAETQIIVQQDGAAATLNLHLLVDEVTDTITPDAFCEVTGSVVRGPAL